MTISQKNSILTVAIITTVLLLFVSLSGKSIYVKNLFASLQLSASQAQTINHAGWNVCAASTSNGTVYVASVEEGEGLYVNTHTKDGNWTDELVDENAAPGQRIGIAINGLDNPYIAYIGADYSARLAYKAAGAWQSEKIADNAANNISIAIGNTGTPQISFWSSHSDSLIYATETSIGWNLTTVDGNGVGLWNSIALTKNDLPRIAYFDRKGEQLMYASFDGSSWTVTTVDDNGAGSWASLAIDKNDQPHIAYFDEQKLNLKYAENKNGMWQVETADSIQGTGEHASLVLDKNNRPWIAYTDIYTYAFKVASKQAQTWTPITVDATSENNGDDAIFFDAKGRLNVFWQDLSANNLKYLIY